MNITINKFASALALAAIAFGTTGALAQTPLAELKKEYERPTETPFPEDNLYTDHKAELGKKLFFEPRLSGHNHFTCAMCHNPSMGWGDGLALGFGEGMNRLGRRTPTILNLAWSESMMWDGRFETLEEQALGPIGASVEMNQPLKDLVPKLQKIKGYVTLFNASFPEDGITLENIAKAIATYERTIVSALAPFDLWVAGDEDAISASAKNGFDLFNDKANCSRCHSGWNFTDDSFHDVGLPITEDRKHLHVSDHLASNDHNMDKDVHIHKTDKGRGDIFENNVKMQHAFKTPGLRNLTDRQPFMHDGTLASVRDVIVHYNTGGAKRPSLSDEMKPLNLTESEIDDLVAFLKSAESQDPPVTLPSLPH